MKSNAARTGTRKAATPRTTTRSYTVSIIRNDKPGSGYWVDIPALPGVVVQGTTLAQTLKRTRESIAAHLEWLVEDGEPLPEDRKPGKGDARPTVTEIVKVVIALP